MAKRGRKPKYKYGASSTRNSSGEVIELGKNRSREFSSTPTRVSIIETLIWNADLRRKLESEFNNKEELVSSVLDIWHSKEDESSRSNAVSKKLSFILYYLCIKPLDPDCYVYTSILYLSQLLPHLFTIPNIMKICTTILQSDPRLGPSLIDLDFTSSNQDMEPPMTPLQTPFRKNPSIALLSCGILYNAFKDTNEWPLPFIQCYMEDAFNARVWVDAESTLVFTMNILTCLPRTKSLPESDSIAKAVRVAGGFDAISVSDDDIRKRWSDESSQRIINFVLNMVQFHEAKKHENLINFVKTLCTIVSIPESRIYGVKYLQEWLGDIVVSRYAKEYMRRLVIETRGSTRQDLDVIDMLLSLKINSQQLITEAISEILKNNPIYPGYALTVFINQELGKSQHNFRLLNIMLNALSDEAESKLAIIFQELAKVQENQIPLQNLIRKIHRIPQGRDSIQLDFIKLACSLLQPYDINNLQSSEKDNWAIQITDLVCLIILLQAPPSHDAKDSYQRIQDFQFKVSTIQKAASIWCHKVCSQIVSSAGLLIHLLKKLLFMESPDKYSFCGNGSENESNVFPLVQHEMPVLEATASSLLFIIKELRINVDIGLDILCHLYYRAASLQLKYGNSFQVIVVTNPAIINEILELTHYPSSRNWISSDQYWKACLLILIIASFNPKSIGEYIWRTNRTVKQMMEMCVMHRFINAPVERDVPSSQKELNAQYQAYNTTRSSEFEKVTDSNMKDLINSGRLILSPPGNCPLELPMPILKQTDKVCKLFKLGKVLCTSRAPDFLVDIMQRQGPKLAVSWLLPIIKDDPTAMSSLPVNALVHILFSYIDDESLSNKFEELVLLIQQFKKIIDSSNTQVSQELLHLLLSSLSTSQRQTTKKACCMLFNCSSISQLSLSTENSPNRPEQVIKQSPARRQSTVFSPLRSPKIRHSPSDNYTSGERKELSINTEQFQELLQIQKQVPSYSWLPALKKLKQFPNCAMIIFENLKEALQKEDVIQDFYSLLVFLQNELSPTLEMKISLACTLGSILQGRKFIVEKLFQSPEIFSFSTLCLWHFYNQRKPSSKETYEIITIEEPKGSSAFTLEENICRGIISLICISAKYYREIENVFTDERFSNVYKDIISCLFSNDKSLTIFNKEKNQFENAITSQNAYDLICSSNELLYTPGVYYFQSNELIQLIGRFGISIDCMKLIYTRLDKDLSQEELKNQFNNLPVGKQRSSIQRISMYSSLGLEKADELLTKLQKQKDTSFSKIENEDDNDITMEVDVPSQDIDYFVLFRDVSQKDLRGMVNEYFTEQDNVKQKDNLLTSLLLCSNIIKESELIIVISSFIRQLRSYLKNENIMNSFIKAIIMKPSLLLRLIDVIRIISLNFNDKEPIESLESFSNELRMKLTSMFSEKERPVSIIVILQYLDNLYPSKSILDEMDDSSIITEEEIIEMVKEQRTTSLEDKLSKLILNQSSEILLLALLNSLSKIPENSKSLGVVLDAIETTSVISFNDEITKKLYEIVFSLKEGSKSYNVLLLSMIVHHGTWNNMQLCCNWLFKLHNINNVNYHYTNILEYIRSYITHPRSWNGYTCEESTMGRQIPTLYSFSPHNINILVDYIREEQIQIKNSNNKLNILTNRMNFMLTILQQKPETLHSVLLHVLDSESMSKDARECYKQIRAVLYLSYPQQVRESGILTTGEEFHGSTRESQLDLKFHKLLRALLDVNLCELAYKVLCSSVIRYKIIFLRYIPMMTSLIVGRYHLDPTAFVEKQFYRLYAHCLGVLDLLRPEVFTCEHLKPLLDCYFSLLERGPEYIDGLLLPLTDKFINFLCYYSLNHSEDLIPYYNTLKGLRKLKLPSLRYLLDMIASHGKGQQLTIESLQTLSIPKNEVNRVKRSMLIWRTSSVFSAIPFNIEEGNNRTNEENIKESIATLEKLDEDSLMNPKLIYPYIDELLIIISSSIAKLRSLGYNLILRYLHHDPISSDKIISKYLNCFSNDSMAVQADALQYAHDLFFFARTESSFFLKQLFDVGQAASPVFKAIVSESTAL